MNHFKDGNTDFNNNDFENAWQHPLSNEFQL